jgi:hypothetical protein
MTSISRSRSATRFFSRTFSASSCLRRLHVVRSEPAEPPGMLISWAAETKNIMGGRDNNDGTTMGLGITSENNRRIRHSELVR